MTSYHKNSHEIWATADILIEENRLNANTAAVAGATDKELPVANGSSGQEASA